LVDRSCFIRRAPRPTVFSFPTRRSSDLERLEQGLKLLLRQSETSFSNHALVKSLIEILNECGVVDNARLESKWRAECAKLNGKADRKSTRLNSSHVAISYAVFCLKKETP